MLQNNLSKHEIRAKQYELSLIQDPEMLTGMGELWDAFLRRTEAHNFFMSHTWITAHIEAFKPKELFIIIIRDTDQIVGIAPLKITKEPFGLFKRPLRTLTLIGNFPAISDYPQICADPSTELQSIVKALAEVLLSKRKSWDIIDFLDCPDSALLKALGEQLELAGLKFTLNLTQKMPCINQLPENLEALHHKMSKRLRKTLNNMTNRLTKDHPQKEVSLVFETDPKQFNQLLEPFVALNIQYWADRKKASVFKQYPLFSTFLMQVFKQQPLDYNAPQLQLSLLMLDNQPMSYQLGLWQGNRYTAYLCNHLAMYQHYKPGLLHFQKLIENTIQRGGASFEFGRGEDDYKYLWADDTVHLWRLTSCQHWIDRADLWLSAFLKRILLSIKTTLKIKILNSIESKV